MSGPEGVAETARAGAIAPPSPSRLERFLQYLRAHPILCLAILTPGLPEYLSTSSPVLNLVANPFWFFFGLAINVGQYTAGALLIREAVIRWKKGWGTLFLLALAYGITEEGLGDNTLFNNTHHVDGTLGVYGHFLGVNWVWSMGVLSFHVIYSIGLPILLLGLALPATRGRRLIGRQGIYVALGSLAASTALETILVWGEYRFWMGIPILVGALLVIGGLVFAARRVPANFWEPRTPTASTGSGTVFAAGFLFFPALFLLEYGVSTYGVPPALVILAELVVLGILLEYLRRTIGQRGNERRLVDLAFGFVAWQAVFGFLLTLGLPYTVPLIVVAVLFFARLRRAYPDRALDPVSPGVGSIPPGAQADIP